MIIDYPEFKKLESALIRGEGRFQIYLNAVNPAALASKPNRREWLSNPSNLLVNEVDALHQALWDAGKKLALEVRYWQIEYVTPRGGPSPLEVFYPVGTDV